MVQLLARRAFWSVLVVSVMALGCTRVPAEEFPRDTNAIKSLSPQQAEALVRQREGYALSLNGLTTLDADVAQQLAKHKGWLHLGGLTMLSDEAAEALAQHQGRLNVSGLTTLSAEAAKALATHRGALFLDGLTAISDEAAKNLAQRKNELVLDSLTSLSEGAAKALAEHKGEYLSLNGLTTLSPEAAKALAGYKGWLILNGLTALSDESAKALAEYKDDLHLNGLTALSAETGNLLDKYKGRGLYLNVRALLVENPLTPETALGRAALLKGDLSLITALDSPDSVAIAKALATRNGPLKLPNLEKISPKTLAAMLEKEDVQIPLIETLELISEPDGSPTDDFVIPEGVRERQRRQATERR